MDVNKTTGFDIMPIWINAHGEAKRDENGEEYIQWRDYSGEYFRQLYCCGLMAQPLGLASGVGA